LKHANSARKKLPPGQCGRATLLAGSAIDEVTFLVEMVVDAGVDGCKLL